MPVFGNFLFIRCRRCCIYILVSTGVSWFFQRVSRHAFCVLGRYSELDLAYSSTYELQFSSIKLIVYLFHLSPYEPRFLCQRFYPYFSTTYLKAPNGTEQSSRVELDTPRSYIQMISVPRWFSPIFSAVLDTPIYSAIYITVYYCISLFSFCICISLHT